MSTPVLPPATSAAQRNLLNALADSIRDAARPHGCLEDFACLRLAYAQFHFERAAALAMQFPENSPEFIKYQKLSLSWEGSFNRAMRQLRELQTLRAQSNPNADAPLRKGCPDRKGRVADPATPPSPTPQPQQNQNFAKRNPHPEEVGRNSPCPCGSGQKYKRCCGPNAAPIYNTQAA
ncbi:MAG: SEC-C domain-containing protein [Bryobacterales bacterium]|nr:SEC-C domain-containing protein [Bryobacterales bacterium]